MYSATARHEHAAKRNANGHRDKLEVARFYERCASSPKSAVGACLQTAEWRAGCIIARQRVMSMQRKRNANGHCDKLEVVELN